MKRQEAYHYSRMRELAQVGKPITESNNLSASTLIDYKRCNDGSALGIVMENHHYFIKTSTNLNENLKASDFAYIGGLENKLDKRYDSVATADKQRNMYIASLNEAFSQKKNVIVNESTEAAPKKTEFSRDLGLKKKSLNETKMISVNQPEATKRRSEDRITLLNESAKNAISNALRKKNVDEDEVDDKLADAEGKLASAPAPEVSAPVVPAETSTELPAPAPDQELPVGDEQPQEDGAEGEEEAPQEGSGLTKKEAQKRVGKLVADLNASEELSSSDFREFTNSLIAGLDYTDEDIDKIIDKLEDKETESPEPEKRTAPADDDSDGVNDAIDARIGALGEGEESDETEDELLLDIDLEADETEDDETETGEGFEAYISERGYDSLEGCDDSEIAGLIMGYMYQIEDTNGLSCLTTFIENEGIKHELIELGGEEFIEQIETLLGNTASDDTENDIETEDGEDELGDEEGVDEGLLGNIGAGLKNIAKTGVNAVVDKAKDLTSTIGQKVQQGVDATKQVYNTGVKSNQLSNIQSQIASVKSLVDKLNQTRSKYNQAPVSISTLLQSAANSLKAGKQPELSKYLNEGFVSNIGSGIKQAVKAGVDTYQKGANADAQRGIVNSIQSQISKIASELNGLNATNAKLGKPAISIQSLLQYAGTNLQHGKNVEVGSRFAENEENDDDMIYEIEDDFSDDSAEVSVEEPIQDTLPVASTGTKTINIDLNNNKVDINLSEGQIRKYVVAKMNEAYDKTSIKYAKGDKLKITSPSHSKTGKFVYVQAVQPVKNDKQKQTAYLVSLDKEGKNDQFSIAQSELGFADKNINESKQNTPKNVLDSIIAEQLSMFKPSEKENSIVNKKSEGETKLQNYIKSRIAEKRAGRKSTILESKKSETLKKLDEMIDREYLKFEKTSK